MPWARRAVAIRLASLCLMVHAGPSLGAPQTSAESPDESCVFSLTLRDFRAILSWELKNRSIVPTHYALWHTDMSGSNVPLELVPECANTTRASCDLTQHWRRPAEMYLLRLVGTRGGTTLVDCWGSIFPDVNMTLEPPEFEITGLVDRINVILKFPPSLPKLPPGEGLWLHLSLSIEEESEGIVKQHRLQIDEHSVGNVTYVLDKLAPSTNYCVSVSLRGSIPSNSRRSPPRCTRLPPSPDPEAWGLAMLLLAVAAAAAALGSTVAMLRRIGYICLWSKLPRALNFYGVTIWAFPELPPLEAVAVAEVIHVHRKKKVWDYSYDDESDGGEEADPRASAGAYTTHGLAVRPPCPGPPSAATPAGGEEAESLTAPGPEPASGAYQEEGSWGAEPASGASQGKGSWGADPASGAYQGKGSWGADPASGASQEEGAWPADPFPEEDSGPTESPAGRVFFNVDLNSVLVRVPDADDSGAPAVFGPPEETGGWEDPEEGPAGPEEDPPAGSGTSAPSTGIGDGYMMR